MNDTNPVIPSAYSPTYREAQLRDRDTAEHYIRHTTIGDPPADAAIASLSHLSSDQTAGILAAAIDTDDNLPADTPRELLSLLRSIPHDPPMWLDPDACNAARQAFHDHSDLFIAAFVVATLRNATTMIAKSFCATGIVTSARALTRIRHNTHHFFEIMMPGSLDHRADGWRLSLRIRLVHAQVRRLILATGDWDRTTYGTPLSAANMALSSANFSETTLSTATRMGARLTPAARHGFMQIWRYASTLIGTPQELLFSGDQTRTRSFLEIAHMCEPAPTQHSRDVANALIQALPDMAGEQSARRRAALIHRSYRISRALLGDSLADTLGFPPDDKLFALLPAMRAKRRIKAAWHRVNPNAAAQWRARRTAFLLEHAVHSRFDYRLPGALGPPGRPTP